MGGRSQLIAAVLAVASIMLSGCVSNTAVAPVVNAWQQPKAKSSYYVVRKGDTIYSIAWAFGLDYRALAAANDLKPPYNIRLGERLSMTTILRGAAPVLAVTSKPAARSLQPVSRAKPVSKSKTTPKTSRSVQKPRSKMSVSVARKPVKGWLWPARGKVVLGFKNTLVGNKGVDISGRFGEPVRASAGGVVVYSGDGIRGYGNLIIIKHNASYLSAYAFNKDNWVKVGQRVSAGQQIAQMGRNNAGQTRLHFEIRLNGKPVNPIRYLRA